MLRAKDFTKPFWHLASPRGRHCYHLHLIGEEAASQGGRVTAEPGLTPRSGPLRCAPAACSFPGEKARSWGALGGGNQGPSTAPHPLPNRTPTHAARDRPAPGTLPARCALPPGAPGEPRPRARFQETSSAKTRGFHTQLDEGPETP